MDAQAGGEPREVGELGGEALARLGLTIVGKVSRGWAAVVVAVPWAVWIAGKAALAVIF